MSSIHAKEIYPVELRVESGDRLAIHWSDGVRHLLSWAVLRKNCPCASCRIEREKPPPLFPILKSGEDQPTRARSLEPVGRYAYKIEWNDGHDTGLYPLELLRRLGEATVEG